MLTKKVHTLITILPITSQIFPHFQNPGKGKRKRPREKLTYTLPEIQNIAQESVKVARVVIPENGFQNKIATSDKTGFVKWMQYCNEWKQISDHQLEKMIEYYIEAHEKIILSQNNSIAQNFYSKLSSWTALGVEKALGKIQLELIKIISKWCIQTKVSATYIFVQAKMFDLYFI